jgi:hypothetical protein
VTYFTQTNVCDVYHTREPFRKAAIGLFLGAALASSPVAADGATIDESEVIVYWHLPAASGIDFAGTGSTGLKLLRTIYGTAVAGDYAKAKFAGTVNGHKRYIGRKFAYEISSDTSSPPTVYQYFVVRPK